MIVENKAAVINFHKITVADLLTECLNYIPDNGLSAADLESRLRLLEIVDKVKQNSAAEIHFNEADFKAAGECVRRMKWRTVHAFIVEFDRLFR